MNIKQFLSLPKTIYFNLKVFNFKTAIKLPIFISFDTKIGNLRKNSIILEGDIRKGMIEIGLSNLEGVGNKRKSFIQIGTNENAKIIFKGNAYFASGALITVDRGCLTIGNNFIANNNFCISCNNKVDFGDNVLIGWNSNFLDSDNHKVIDEKSKISKNDRISIGNHVWIGANCDFLKGANIGDNSIVGYKSLVNKKFNSNTIIAGSPAKMIKENINWE